MADQRRVIEPLDPARRGRLRELLAEVGDAPWTTSPEDWLAAHPDVDLTGLVRDYPDPELNRWVERLRILLYWTPAPDVDPARARAQLADPPRCLVVTADPELAYCAGEQATIVGGVLFVDTDDEDTARQLAGTVDCILFDWHNRIEEAEGPRGLMNRSPLLAELAAIRPTATLISPAEQGRSLLAACEAAAAHGALDTINMFDPDAWVDAVAQLTGRRLLRNADLWNHRGITFDDLAGYEHRPPPPPPHPITLQPVDGPATDVDPLTGLPVRARFLKAVDEHLAARAAGTRVGCLAALDVDGMKDLNDRDGHEAGDRVLAALAAHLGTHLSAHAFLARLGSDEFGALFSDRSADAVHALLTEALNERLLAACGVGTTVAAGIASRRDDPASTPDRRESPETLVAWAMNAVSFAKTQHPGAIVVAERGQLRSLREERRTLLDAVQTDVRTGLRNHAAFERELAELHAEAQAEGASFGLILADLDHFHDFNRTHGMLAGNEALRVVARTLARAVPGGTVYRYGGEEFTILLPAPCSQAEVNAAGRSAVAAVRAAGIPVGAHDQVQVTLTVAGTAHDPLRGPSEDAIRATDDALIAAKSSGRDRYVSAPMSEESG